MEEEHEIELYEKPDGSCPIANFLENLEPLVKPLEDGIFELRTQVGNNISRVFYFFFIGKKIILTNGFIKKTQKTPRKYIDLAIEFKTEYLSRGGSHD